MHRYAAANPVPELRARSAHAAPNFTDTREQERMVQALREPGRLTDGPVELIETHISYVLLTGTHAYKIKKAVALPFLDFRTLAARRRFCDEELRVNRRLSPGLYLGVVPITGTAAEPRLGGTGDVLDYAVRMREFPQEALLCNVLERGALAPAHIDALAAQVARFHAKASRATPASRFGRPRDVLAAALANFAAGSMHATDESERTVLRELERWTRTTFAASHEALQHRRRTGAIRECHGDLHLGNIALVDDDVALFDCIEFDPALRWIDTMSDIAFTVMDLEHRGQPGLARRFLDAYLEHTGDYAGFGVLRFYLVYRAMVRAKVAWMRAAHVAASCGQAVFANEAAAYVRLAAAYAQDTHPALVLMHGPSGCGKSAVSQLLVQRSSAVRIRTDIERKRLAGLSPGARSGSGLAGGLYTAETTRRTYAQVLECARHVIAGGFPAVIDGTFLSSWQRDAFHALADAERVPFVIVDCVTAASTLESRVLARSRAGGDASEADIAVLEHQLRTADSLRPTEQACVVTLDTEAPLAKIPRQASWRALLDRIGATPGAHGAGA